MDMSLKNVRFALLLIVAFSISFIGCGLQGSGTETTPIPPTPDVIDKTTTPRLQPTILTTESPTVLSTNILTPTSSALDSPCRWPPQKILENVTTMQFAWADDGKSLFYTNDGGDDAQWLRYDLESKQSSQSDVKPVLYRQLFYREWAEEFGLDDYTDIILSPDKRSVLYTISESGSYQVYYLRSGEKQPTLLGYIKGRPYESFWLEDKEKVLISISYQAPQNLPEDVQKYYAYLIDMPAARIHPLLPLRDYTDVGIVSITPDGEWVLFVEYTGHVRFISLYNVETGETKQTNAWIPISTQWLENGLQLVAAGHFNGEEPVTLYMFDITTNESKRLTEHPLSSAVRISPDLRYVAFQEGADGIYLMDCTMADWK